MHPLAFLAQWPIHRLMLVGFSLVFITISAVGLGAYRTTATLIANNKLDAKSYRSIKGIDELLALMEDLDRAYRRFLVTGDQSYLEGRQASTELISAYLLTMAESSTGTDDQRERISRLQRQIQHLLEIQKTGIVKRQQQGYQGVLPLLFGKDAHRDLDTSRALMTSVAEEENRILRERREESAQQTRWSVGLLGLATLLQFLLLASVYLIIRHDIGERQRVAAELARRGELLEAANQELEAFSYSVSHDLRAPLRHIDGYVSLLERNAGKALNAQGARYLATISQAAKQMGQLIDDLLDFSRMGRADMLCTSVDLNQLMQDVRQRVQGETDNRRIQWHIHSLPSVQGDPALLRQVFVNLLSNAIKFTSSREEPQIEIGADLSSPEDPVVFVKDNGVGFDMQYVDKLFGVFQRLHRAEEFEGTGIGLANVRRIVHRHGGRAWAEAQPDHGATFYVSLKRAA